MAKKENIPQKEIASITIEQLINIVGLNQHTAYALRKKYPNNIETKTLFDWSKILVTEQFTDTVPNILAEQLSDVELKQFQPKELTGTNGNSNI